jgi:hypothetical protein
MTQQPLGWSQLPLDSWLETRAPETASSPLPGRLATLPLDLLSWENFERLQWRVLRDVLGLRHAFLYGERGQAQKGLDVIALNPEGAGVALQSKRVKEFSRQDLLNALEKFETTRRPFDVDRLIIGVSRLVASRQVLDELSAQQRRLHPLRLDLWDQRELSQRLNPHPGIVLEFFSSETAQAFCGQFTVEVPTVPAADAIAVREALARTPGVTTGADALVTQATAAEATAPDRALELVEQAQAILRSAGFPAHAATHEKQRGQLLMRLGRAPDAVRTILDAVWSALDRGSHITAQISQRRLREMTREVAIDEPGQYMLNTAVDVVNSAIGLYVNPLGRVPKLDELPACDPEDRARLLITAGETALAGADFDWLRGAIDAVEDAANGIQTGTLAWVRLKLLVADATDEWTDVLSLARRRRLDPGGRALVNARYARRCALRQLFVEADAQWDEAVGEACLGRHWGDAGNWLLSRRAFASRWHVIPVDDLFPAQLALADQGPGTPIISTDENAHNGALADLSTDKLRSAAISAHRALRDAVATGSWNAERSARQLVAKVLDKSGEPVMAAHHLAMAGDPDAIGKLADGNPRRFLDVTADLETPNYWTVGTAFRLIGRQGDLVPDKLVESIGEHILTAIRGREAQTLTDHPSLNSSQYLGAVSALSTLGGRLTLAQADEVLAHFERQPPVEPNHYRYHDDNEAQAVASIGLAHESLRLRAIAHLVPLLARSPSARKSAATELIEAHWEMARPLLEPLAATDMWSSDQIGYHEPALVDPKSAAEALHRLTTPLQHTKGMATRGTRAIEDSILVAGLPATELTKAGMELLARADESNVGSGDRGDYLVAASNLAPHLTADDRSSLFVEAMRRATHPTPSSADEATKRFSHPLGALKFDGVSFDVRAKAVFVAAGLARTPEQRAEVRQVSFDLLGSDQETAYWVTRTLQRLGRETLAHDIGFLSGQGWAMRSLAAIVWVGTGEPPYIGMRLANDDDVRVRRALAGAIDGSTQVEQVRDVLLIDPSFSVRTMVRGK